MSQKVYIISIVNSSNQLVSYNVLAETLAAAIAKAQTAAGVASDPKSFQQILPGTGVIDLVA